MRGAKALWKITKMDAKIASLFNINTGIYARVLQWKKKNYQTLISNENPNDA